MPDMRPAEYQTTVPLKFLMSVKGCIQDSVKGRFGQYLDF